MRYASSCSRRQLTQRPQSVNAQRRRSLGAIRPKQDSYIILTSKAQGFTQKREQRDSKSQRLVGDFRETLCSGYNKADAHMNSQGLWQNTRAGQNLHMEEGKVVTKSQALAEEHCDTWYIDHTILWAGSRPGSNWPIQVDSRRFLKREGRDHGVGWSGRWRTIWKELGVEKDEQNALYEKNKTQTKTTSLIHGLLENSHWAAYWKRKR